MTTLIDKRKPAESAFKVSQSKVKTFRECRKKYHYKYVEGLRKRIKSRPLVFGTVIHKMIEADAAGDDPFEKLDQIDLTNMKLFQAERELYGEIIEDVRCIMTDYFDYWSKHEKKIIYSRKNKRSAEHEFEIEIAPGIVFTGKIDGVGTSKKMRWVIEHKSFKRMPNEDKRWRSVQSGVYIRALDMMGWWSDIQGTLWDYISNRPPDAPAILQSGKISEAKLNSLPSRVKAFLDTQGETPKEFPKLWSQVKENRDNYFLRIYTPLNDRVVNETWEDFVATAKEMQALHGKAQQRSVGNWCDWCDYNKLCQGTVLGLDVDFIIEREYSYDPEEPIDGEVEED